MSTLREPLFHCADLGTGDVVILADDEAHHVTVQRLRRGDAVALFDGQGHLARGTIETIGRATVDIRVRERRHDAPPTPRFDLYAAVPKGDRAAVLLDMATQLGMARFTPLAWHRRVADPGPRALARWRRICIEACKQSRRTHVPEIAAPATAPEAAARAAAAGDQLLVAHPGAGALPLLATPPPRTNRIALFIGPEGGLTDAEIDMLRGLNAQIVSLGPAILRIETAAIALLAALNARSETNID